MSHPIPTALLPNETPIRVLRDDGSRDPATDPLLEREELRKIYRTMVLTRAIDDRLLTLQRQGRVGFHVGSQGEEAAIIGAAHALRSQDWVFPCYREIGAALHRGMPLLRLFDNVFGNARDGAKGRQMPDHVTCRAVNYVSVSSPIGTQITQCTGVAWAAKLKKEDVVSLCYFGDGATSSNDFHAAMNMAGVHKLPAIFFCRNNGWAISVPTEKQTASATFAHKAIAYGMPGVRVDGNDVFAVIAAVREAVARASRGEGPTFIEAITYRTGAHTTSDDPNRYRTEEELRPWLERDPLERLRRSMEQHGEWSDAEEAALSAELEGEIQAARDAAEKVGAPALQTLHEDVYAQMPWHLREQQAELLRGPRAPQGH